MRRKTVFERRARYNNPCYTIYTGTMYNFFIISTSRMEEEPYLSEINNRHASKLDEWGWLEYGEYRLSLLLSTIPELDRSRSWFHLDLQVDLFVVIQFEFSKGSKGRGSFGSVFKRRVCFSTVRVKMSEISFLEFIKRLNL